MKKNKQRILLLEDSVELALVLKSWLSSEFSQELVHTTDLPEARALLARQAWDVLITDIELPSGNCFELVAYAKLAHPDLRVLIMTSHQRADYAVQALRLKADDFLFKPFEKQELLSKVTLLLAAKAAATPKRRVLAIGAHPDDVELGCAGALRAHVLAGDWVHVLTLCMGEAGGERSVREAESLRAAQILGVSLTMSTLRDSSISEGPETISVIEEVVKRINPTVIYTHSPHDAHQDHRNVFRATVVAARQVASLMCYQSPSATIEFRPTRFTEISGTLEMKLQAIATYTSQVLQRPYMAPAMIEATARYWGRFAGYGLCEPFEVIRELSV